MTVNPEDIQYTPPSSIGREIGVTFAFIGAFLVTVILYGLAWRGEYFPSIPSYPNSPIYALQ